MSAKRIISLLCLTGMVFVLLCGQTALSDGQNSMAAALRRDERLPDRVHYIKLPDGMLYQAPSGEEKDLKGIWLMEPKMEIEIFSYDAPGAELQSLAEQLTAAGRTAEIREIGGMNFLVFQDRDEADGALCIGYAYLWEGRMIEISFFCATQDAMELSKAVMESFH